MKVLVFVATGFEDVELITTLDVFNRRNIKYDLYSPENLEIVKGKFEAHVKTKKIDNLDIIEYTALFLPGGPGHIILKENKKVIQTIKEFKNNDKLITAICAAPEILVYANVIDEKQKITAFPGFANISNNTREDVVIESNLITARDYESTLSFANAICDKLI